MNSLSSHFRGITQCTKTWKCSREPVLTISNLELGRAPATEATKILAMQGPRGMITLSLMDTYCLSIGDCARSNISVKKPNIDFEASLQGNIIDK